MDYTILGRTGLRVSVMGVGGGGPSRLGKNTGRDESESVAVIRQALDAGVNFIDTAEGYRTEEIVGKAIEGMDRSSLVLSTKKSTSASTTPQDVEKSIEDSLRRLGTDYVDIYHLHGVHPEEYDHLASEIVPTLQKLREAGKIRFIGVTEHFGSDPRHTMLQKALQDDVWDVIMIGFNILNQCAREYVFPKTIENNIGVLIMFAVRIALSRPQRLAEVVQELLERKQLDPADFDVDDPLGFLIHDAGAVSVVDAAYRLCRDEPGTHVVLSGTGNVEHMKANIESFSRPPLPDADLQKLKYIFRRVDSVSGG